MAASLWRIWCEHALEEDIADYRARGADSVLQKPIDVDEFFKVMREFGILEML
jgi:hypothetical protein